MFILLNILRRTKEEKREKKERKHIMNYIILSLILTMNIETSIYKEAMSEVARGGGRWLVVE